VFDRHGRLPADSKLALSAGPDAPVLVECDPGAALFELGRRRISALLLEGGATLATAFLDAGLIDRVMLFTAPIELGEGPGLFTRPVELPAVVESSKSGPDILSVTELREP
jgi:diaminohydroxyphosphoribosylaminopyrimidine deaminase/5-amino-6-(5-phosphoribosylamino)uracil reductase